MGSTLPLTRFVKTNLHQLQDSCKEVFDAEVPFLTHSIKLGDTGWGWWWRAHLTHKGFHVTVNSSNSSIQEVEACQDMEFKVILLHYPASLRPGWAM